MATTRVMRSVLANFLDTYVSRYSDHDGYWVFGFLVSDLQELRIDLLEPPPGDADTPLGLALRSAVTRFADQVHKARLVRAQIREAWLTMRRSPGTFVGVINERECTGYRVHFSASAVMNDDRRYERERVVFVAPHDPEVEHRSARAT